MFKIICSILVITSFVACSRNDKRLKEKAALESESSTTSQLRVENENLAKKAALMELDLMKRHRFYQAVKGSYEGIIETSFGRRKIEITLTPTKAPLPITRVRQLDEIATELNGLNLTAHAIQSDPNNPNAAVGCAGITVMDDLIKGELAISSSTCPNLYLIKITERGSDGSSIENSLTASRIAHQIINGDLIEVDSISGVLKTSTFASKINFVAYKVVE